MKALTKKQINQVKQAINKDGRYITLSLSNCTKGKTSHIIKFQAHSLSESNVLYVDVAKNAAIINIDTVSYRELNKQR